MSVEDLTVISGGYSGSAQGAVGAAGRLAQQDGSSEAETLYSEASGEASDADLFSSETRETVTASNENAEATAENNGAQSESHSIIDTITEGISTVVSTILGLDEDIDETEGKIEETSATITGLEGEKAGLESKAATLEGSESEEARQQAAQYRQQAAQVQTEITKAEAEEEQLETQEEGLQTEKADEEAKKGELEGEKADEEGNLDELETEGKRLEGEKEDIDSDADGQTEEGKQGQQEADQTAAEAEELISQNSGQQDGVTPMSSTSGVETGNETPTGSSGSAQGSTGQGTTGQAGGTQATAPQETAPQTPAVQTPTTPDASYSVPETDGFETQPYTDPFAYYYDNPYARIGENFETDYDMAHTIVNDMFYGVPTDCAVEDMLGMSAIDAVSVAAEAYTTETYSNTVYSQKVSTKTDTSTVEENQKAVSEFMDAYTTASEKVDNPNVEFVSLTDESNYKMAGQILSRLNDGEYILTREINKATKTVETIEVSATETQDEENAKYDVKGSQLLAQLKAIVTEDKDAPEDSTDKILTEKEYSDEENFFNSADDKSAAYSKLVTDAERYGIYAAA